MLVLSRKKGEQIRIGDDIVITVHRVSGNRVSIGIEAPASLRIVRGELQAVVDEFKEPAPPAQPPRKITRSITRPTPNVAAETSVATGENRIAAHLPSALRTS
jgi:carbon storage regulator